MAIKAKHIAPDTAGGQAVRAKVAELLESLPSGQSSTQGYTSQPSSSATRQQSDDSWSACFGCLFWVILIVLIRSCASGPNEGRAPSSSTYTPPVASTPSTAPNYGTSASQPSAGTNWEQRILSGKINANKAKLDELWNQLDEKKMEIDALESRLKMVNSDIELERISLDRTDSIALRKFKAKVDEYNSDVRKQKRMISRYNELVEEYETLRKETKAMVDRYNTM